MIEGDKASIDLSDHRVLCEVIDGEWRVVGHELLKQPAGDALEELLASYGITKEWYQGFKKEHGLPPVCNCEARQEWLNKVSAAHPQIANIGVKILNALKRK